MWETETGRGREKERKRWQKAEDIDEKKREGEKEYQLKYALSLASSIPQTKGERERECGLFTDNGGNSLSERVLADRGNSRCHGVTLYSALQWHNLWRHTLDVSSDIHPRYSLKENECTSPKFQLNTNTVTIGGVTVHTTWIFEVYIAMANSFVPTRGLVCLTTVPTLTLPWYRMKY